MFYPNFNRILARMLENLNEKFINPALRNMFPDYANSFNYSSTTINQSEICFDITAASMKDVKMLEALSCKSNEIVNTDYLKNKI